MGRKEDLSTKSNKGFSLITVILTVGLVGILVMLVAYMVIANFHMKMSGLKGKDGFYTAERALEEIRTGLQEDVAEAMSEAYTSVMESYSRSNSNTDVAMDVQRQAAYEKQFLSTLHTRLEKSETSKTEYNIGKLRNYVDLNKENSFDEEKESLVVTTISKDKNEVLDVDYTKKKVTLKNLKVIYVDERGYAAIIQTDIQLSVPQIQFPTPSTLPDLMNMIVVAGQGIYCEGETSDNSVITDEDNGIPNKDNEIEGSVYAGILPKNRQTVDATSDTSIYIAPGRTLKISKGERTVSAGEVTVGSQGTFTSAAETTLWAQGVNVSSSTVQLLGKTYLSDDLTVKPGTGSYVRLSGEYYGYGNVKSAKESENRIEYGYPKSTDSTQTTKNYEKKTTSALSSAITINGKSTTLDMSGLDRLLLAGRNYIASKALSASGALRSGTDSKENSDDVLTGESVTVKGTQLAYLVPDSLFIGDYHNPMTYSDYAAENAADLESTDSAATVKQKIKEFANTKISTTKTVKTLGNKSLSEIGVDKDEPVQTVFYNDGSGGYVYFYLNFTDEKKASDFLQDYYNNHTSLKKAMDTYLSFYFTGDSLANSTSGIYVKNPDAYTRYIVGGNILSYNGSTKSGKLDERTTEETSSAVTEEETSYQNMWYALKRKMIGSYDLLKKEVKDKDGIAHDETAVDRNVFDNLVNEKDLVEFIESAASHQAANKSIIYDKSEKSCTFTDSRENGGLQSIMAHNGASSTYLVKDESASAPAGGTKAATKKKTVKGAGKELVIDAVRAKKLRLVVCTGDVRIKANVTFHGIIMAKGTIILEPGAKLYSSPLDAAKAFQSQINSSEGTSPKDFFWEGDKYVLGNSQTSSDNTNSDKDSDVYHVEDYITYENWERK